MTTPSFRYVSCCSIALVVGLLGAVVYVISLSVAPKPAFAAVLDGCIEDVFNEYNGGGSLNCTSNDIEIVALSNVTILDDGCAFVGDTVTFDADFTVQLNATARHDIGLYIATDGGDAITGSCVVDTLSLSTSGVVDLDGTSDDTNGADAFGYCSPDSGGTLSVPTQPCNENADCVFGDTCEEFGPGIQDTCGDMNSANNPIVTRIANLTILCLDDDDDGSADLPYSASWRQPGANDLCLAELAAFPGNVAKCKEGLRVSQIPIAKTINVIKDLTPNTDPGLFNLEVDGNVEFADAGDGDMTGEVAVSVGVHTVSESAGTGTSLSGYNTDITCQDTVGRCTLDNAIACLTDPICRDNAAGTCDLTPTTVASCTGCTSLTLPLLSQQCAIVCTISNTSVCETLNCDDGVGCTDDSCNPQTGQCVNTANNANCDDGVWCTDDVCDPINDCQFTTLSCDDGVACTDDACDVETGDCVNTANDAKCSAPDPPCEGGQVCDAAAGCVDLQDAELSTPCDADGDLCTQDHCDGSGQCVFLTGTPCCGNGVIDPNAGETCDPPGASICPGGAECPADCVCHCGNGVLDPGEQCDPPELQPAENCGNQIDDDGDGLVDCRDAEDCPAFCKRDRTDPDDAITDVPCTNHRTCRLQFGRLADCFSVGTCDSQCQIANRCERIDRDPARICFGTKPGAFDRFRFHGRFVVPEVADPAVEGLTVTLSNENGVIYQGTLLPGDLSLNARGTAYIYKDQTVRESGGKRDGLVLVKVKYRTIRGKPNLVVHLKALGDLSQATIPRMAIQVDLGSFGGYTETEWEVIRNGWRARY
jgi:hypothetical protein